MKNETNGIVLVDKPAGFTSFDVVAVMRGLFGTRKVGHSGTLDPMATGLLPIFIGKATRACDISLDLPKAYIGEFKFGEETDTEDATGTVINRTEKKITRDEIEKAVPNFIGEIEQVPPMYSAVKVNGKRLYEYARKGQRVTPQTRLKIVYYLKVLEFNEEEQTSKFEIKCQSGTYVRTLISDLAKSIGTYAYMTGLRRTEALGYYIDSAYTLDEIKELKKLGELEKCVLPIEDLFKDVPKIHLDEEQTGLYKNGVRLSLIGIKGYSYGINKYAVYGFDGKFIGTAETDAKREKLKILKNF